jgi:hypothetical protein
MPKAAAWANPGQGQAVSGGFGLAQHLRKPKPGLLGQARPEQQPQLGKLRLINRVTVYIPYNYCIHVLRDEGVHIYIYRYGINCIIRLYR